MIKKLILLCVIISVNYYENVFAQDQKIADSLLEIYQKQSLPDSVKLSMLQSLSFNEIKDFKKGLEFAERLIKLAEKLGDDKYQRIGYFLKGTKYRLIGELDNALEAYIKSAELAKKSGYLKGEGEIYGAIADIYASSKNFVNAYLYYNKSIGILKSVPSPSSNDSISLASFISNKGDAFLNEKKFDSALHYFFEAKSFFDRLNHLSGIGYSLGNIGMVYASLGKNEMAEQNMSEAIHILEEAQDYYPICVYLVSIADIYAGKGELKTAIFYANKSLQLAEHHGLKQQIAEASFKLYDLYEQTGNTKSALEHYIKHISFRDSVNNIATVQRMADLRTDFEVSKKQAEVNLLSQQKRSQRNLLFALIIILILTASILVVIIRSNNHKRNAFHVLSLQKQKTDEQRERAESALIELKETQKQLIQSAKMASLGELAAGIAHEIQNPLNFVNNFSEISVELLDELKESTLNKLSAGDKTDATELALELDNNLKKITLHGKRAEAIVKGMLQHSRMQSGQHEPADVNALIEEFLHLSYSGIRAVDKNFQAEFETHLDSNIGKVDVIPQDIGRVFLNIFQNAFYAVDKKKKSSDPSYQPLVSVVSIKNERDNKVEVIISDNGTGISEAALDKIFQPFFTTKPTGQGTGLGLWLSYDIIKAHNGDIKVESNEGEFTRFTISLPLMRKKITPASTTV